MLKIHLYQVAVKDNVHNHIVSFYKSSALKSW